jgi:hypothetical protein
MKYSQPEITESINKLTYLWKPMDLKIVADRITDAGSADLWFYHTNGDGDSLMHVAKVNLMASPTMTQLAKRMTQHSEDAPWTQILTCITSRTMEYQRRGEPGALIIPEPGKVFRPTYYIDPIIMKGVPNIIFGDKGVSKTTISLALLGIVVLGSKDSPLGFACNQPVNVALLDWESNQSLTEYSMARLIEGGVVQGFPLPYLRCKQALADDVDRIGNFLHDNSSDLVLIDSLGQAAGSDKFDSSGKAVALRFFEVLRQLNVTSLIIAQNAKSEENKKTIFGSTYFTYYARNIFELRGKQDELDSDQVHIAFYHHESNYSKKHEPIGFSLKYSPDAIRMEPEDVSSSKFFERASQTKDMLNFLKDGSKSVPSISTALGLTDNQIRVNLSRLKKRGLVNSLGSGMWQLTDKAEDY